MPSSSNILDDNKDRLALKRTLSSEEVEEKGPSLQKVKIFRGFSNKPMDEKTDNTKELVINAMEWDGVKVADIIVENKSGLGGSKTYKISAPQKVPLCLYVRRNTEVADDICDLRMEEIASIAASKGCAPKRVAQGSGTAKWFIENWDGQGEPDMTNAEHVKHAGKLLAELHKIPAEWFEK